MKFSFRYSVGDFVIFDNQILTIKSFGYFWEGVCELSNGVCCRLRHLNSIDDLSNFSEKKIEYIISNTVYKSFIRSLVPSTR